MGKVTVFRDKYPKGWEGETEEGTGAPTRDGAALDLWPIGPLEKALAHEFKTDAHFVPYHLEGQERSPRLNWSQSRGTHIDIHTGRIEALGTRVLFDVILVDIDGPGHAATDEWKEEQVSKLDGTFLEDGMGWYFTRGGLRLLWYLPEPLPPLEYSRTLMGLREALSGFGVEADPLTDWTRLYRLPYVNRDGSDERHEADWSWMDGETLNLSLLPPAAGSGMGPFGGIANVNPPLRVADLIPQSERNQTLFKMAASHRAKGYGEAEILGFLRISNESRCDPPLPDPELVQIARSACRYAPGPTPGPKPEESRSIQPSGEQARRGSQVFLLGSELEIAEAVMRQLEQGGEKMVYDRSFLLHYKPNRGLWETVGPNALKRILATFDGDLVVSGADTSGNRKYKRLRVTDRLSRSVVNMCHDQRTVEGWLERQTDGILFGDCFVRVDADGIHREDFSAEHRQITGLPFEYHPGAEPTEFLEMLRSCWAPDFDCPDKIQLLREFIGAALCNRGTLYQKALILVGEGANGKSTVQEIVRALFPSDSVTSVNPQIMDNEYRRAELAKSRLNLVSELPTARILASEAVKAMITGDLMDAREIRQAPFKYRPRASHLFSANNLPGVHDLSRGFWRRWLVIPFNKEFAEHEQDRHLAGRIISRELAQVASWALDGAAQLAASGHYTTPESSERAVEEWRRAADQAALFVEEMCELTMGGEPLPKADWTSADDLYSHYAHWSRETGHHQLSKGKFKDRLQTLGIEQRRDCKARWWPVRLVRPKLGMPTSVDSSNAHLRHGSSHRNSIEKNHCGI